MIRPAVRDDLPRLREIEKAAGALFGAIGMHAVAEDEPPSVEELAGYQMAGRAWVAAGPGDFPVGYLLLDIVDGGGHIEQVTVHPDHGRQRLGAALLQTAEGWARARGLGTLTLTTFAEVPWNAPYYARLGFDVVAPENLSEGLRLIRAAEAARGLDAWPRVVMRRAVSDRSLSGTAPRRRA